MIVEPKTKMETALGFGWMCRCMVLSCVFIRGGREGSPKRWFVFEGGGGSWRLSNLDLALLVLIGACLVYLCWRGVLCDGSSCCAMFLVRGVVVVVMRRRGGEGGGVEQYCR